MNSVDQHFFIVGAIEHRQFAPSRGKRCGCAIKDHGLVQAPVGTLMSTYRVPLGIDAGHDVFNHAVFAGCIHPLKDNQDAVLFLRRQVLLNFGEHLDVMFNVCFDLLFLF